MRNRSKPKRKVFPAESAGKARNAAVVWLHDFTRHGPLDIHSIRTAPHQDQFVAIVTYKGLPLALA